MYQISTSGSKWHLLDSSWHWQLTSAVEVGLRLLHAPIRIEAQLALTLKTECLSLVSRSSKR